MLENYENVTVQNQKIFSLTIFSEKRGKCLQWENVSGVYIGSLWHPGVDIFLEMCIRKEEVRYSCIPNLK